MWRAACQLEASDTRCSVSVSQVVARTEASRHPASGSIHLISVRASAADIKHMNFYVALRKRNANVQ
jgi:hypothetical protein